MSIDTAVNWCRCESTYSHLLAPVLGAFILFSGLVSLEPSFLKVQYPEYSTRYCTSSLVRNGNVALRALANDHVHAPSTLLVSQEVIFSQVGREGVRTTITVFSPLAGNAIYPTTS